MLTSDNYLEHLERFSALYEAGEVGREVTQGLTSKNVGLVVVVAPTSELAKNGSPSSSTSMLAVVTRTVTV